MIWTIALLSGAVIVGGIVGALITDRRWARLHRERVRELRRLHTYHIPVTSRVNAISRRDDLVVPPHTN
jgi:hypothetical protein